jgi:hypothetical protein
MHSLQLYTYQWFTVKVYLFSVYPNLILSNKPEGKVIKKDSVFCEHMGTELYLNSTVQPPVALVARRAK